MCTSPFRTSLFSALAFAGLVSPLSAQVQQVALRPASAAAIAPAQPHTTPAVGQLGPWHVWSDPEGHTVFAEFRTLDGDYVTVQTKEAKSYRLNLNKLVAADREFANQMDKARPKPMPVSTAAAKIDQLVLAGLTKAGQKPNPPATAEQLVRRFYLDIAGRIPTATETAAFVDDKAPNKSARLIDRLLASEGYNSHMFNWLADMLRVEDDYGKGTKTYVYEDWLKDQIAANRPWNEIVKDLLDSSGRLSEVGPVGYLLRDKGMPLDSLSNTLTIFLGANVACAQCHNHPLASWKQRDFYEMAAFFGATDTGNAKGGKKKAKQIAKSTDLPKKLVQQVVASNTAGVEDMHKDTLTFPKDYKYPDAKPGEPVPPKLIQWKEGDAKNPAYAVNTTDPENLREQFANWLTHADNPRFATAIANRLWKRAFGLAVQEPVTDLDDLSKASNPELLAQLTEEMRRVKFDLREFQRIVFNTQTYQRQASLTPDLGKGPYLFPGPLLRRMTAEQAWDSVLTLVVGPELDQFQLRRGDEIRALAIPGAALTKDAVVAKVMELQASGDNPKKGKGKTANKKTGGGTDVTPSEYEGEPPPQFQGLTLARASELPQPAKEAHFLRMFGQSDRQLADGGSLEGGVPQVLMMMNGDVQRVIASSGSMVLKDAARQQTPNLKVESLYFSFLGRRPTIPETQTACRTLKDGLALGDLTWVLFNSREFIFIQ
jgi:Protein of unknown function (DUF1549)/Protein of unknown function (DUF1553)